MNTITDFVGGRVIEVGELQKMLAAAQKRPEHLFSMWQWFTCLDCGTAGCLVGTYVMDCLGATPDGVTASEIARSFGLSTHERRFLFSGGHLHQELGYWCLGNRQPTTNALELTQEQAIARLRKFIAYKLRKAMYTGNDDARYLGDVGICQNINDVTTNQHANIAV